MCREFVEAAKQRRCDHSCLRCTSAAVMFPPWTQQEEAKHMGDGSESQPAGSLHMAAQICCLLMHKPPTETVSLRLSHYQENKEKPVQKDFRWCSSLEANRLLNWNNCWWVMLCHLLAHVSKALSNATTVTIDTAVTCGPNDFPTPFQTAANKWSSYFRAMGRSSCAKAWKGCVQTEHSLSDILCTYLNNEYEIYLHHKVPSKMTTLDLI